MKFSGHLQSIQIYSVSFIFYKGMFRLEVIAWNLSKLRFFRIFRTLIIIYVWTAAWFNLKLSGNVKSIKIYSLKYGFYICMFQLKVIAQNPSKSAFFQFFKFWSVKYTRIVVTSSNCVQTLTQTIVNRFTKFDCWIKSITAVIKVLQRPIF